MCGRYALYGPSSRLREHFEVDFDPVGFAPHYNIALQQLPPVVRWQTGGHAPPGTSRIAHALAKAQRGWHNRGNSLPAPGWATRGDELF